MSDLTGQQHADIALAALDLLPARFGNIDTAYAEARGSIVALARLAADAEQQRQRAERAEAALDHVLDEAVRYIAALAAEERA